MSRGKNTIKLSDVSTTPIKLKYSASYSSTELSNLGISIVRGINTPITSSVKVPQFKINYNLIEQLFYRSYISGSLIGSGSAYNDTLQSTAASGTFDDDIRYFPTHSGAEVVYLYIPKNVFGEQIARKSFTISSSFYNIYDDGNGNIYDGTTHVGNIIYSQAFVIITNPNYRCYFVDTSFDFSVTSTTSVDPILPTPSVTATPSVTPSITVSITPSVSPGASPSVTPTATPSMTATPSTTPTSTPSITPSKTPSATPSVTPSVTPSETPSITPSSTPPATVYYYIANRYDSGCNLIASYVNVRSISPLLNNFFCGTVDGYKYEIVGPNPGATSGTNIDASSGAATCAALSC